MQIQMTTAPVTGSALVASADTCNKIVCGFIPQNQVPASVLLRCAQSGYMGNRVGCMDPQCIPYSEGRCGNHPFGAAPQSLKPDKSLIPASTMPSITGSREPSGIVQAATGSGCGFSGWVQDHQAAAALLLAGVYLLFGRK